jgi:hypothetical protein
MNKSNNKYHQTAAWSLILLVLMTSLSFTIDTHYCEGELQNISFFGKAEPCQKANATKEVYCPVHKKMMIMDEKNSCCENKTILVDNDDDLKDINFSIPTIQQLQQFAIAYALVFHAKITIDTQSLHTFLYQSPIIPREIYALSETFLL